MPKATFFNLVPKKRDGFIEAAVEEFCRHSYHNVNIRDIVRKANISIGSFYCYFDSKTELFVYITDYMFQNVLKLKEQIEQSGQKLTMEQILEREPQQKAFWSLFQQCPLDKRKHYYMRTDTNPLFERFLEEVKQYPTKTEYTEREKRMVAFVINAQQYILDEFTQAEGTEPITDDELRKIKKMLIIGYQNLER